VQQCFIYDPKSGEDITKYLGTFLNLESLYPEDSRCVLDF
jgi:hypothetical protein